MKLGMNFLKAAALSAVLMLTGCADEKESDIISSKTHISHDDLISGLEDGIHQLSIPASVSGEATNQIHVIVKDKAGMLDHSHGFALSLGSFIDDTPPSLTEITVKTIEKDSFLKNLKDGVSQLKVDGKAFPDGQNRTFTVAKDKAGVLNHSHGFAVTLSSSITPD